MQQYCKSTVDQFGCCTAATTLDISPRSAGEMEYQDPRAKDTGSVEMASISKKPKEGRGKPKFRSSAPVNKKPAMTIGRIAEAAANNEQPPQ